ncbi:MAG: type II toxin-antitoxin system YafQ family toxin [Lachnospiraceae bacterium]|nr:type II toxin-antitoxin system YafQ family toxin [Lachnospiraceae bacterium]
MLELVTTGQFRKDYKRVKKRGYDMGMLEEVIDLLLKEQPLDERYWDHGLIGNYEGFCECHILPDWLLIYAKDKEQLILTASRTGTHADLFAR